MFYYLNGKLAHLEASFAVIDCGGVGYRLSISGTTYDLLAPKRTSQEPVRLFTHLAVREDDIELFGFFTQTELATFRLLLTVSGVGPKVALSVLSYLTPEKVAIAICTDDRKTLGRASGVGPKTAARIILELKDKMMKEAGDLPDTPTLDRSALQSGGRSVLNEAIDALIVLGYSRSEAMSALKDTDPSAELQEIIRAALKKLVRPV